MKQGPKLREALAVPPRFTRALNLTFLAIVALTAMFFLRMRGLNTPSAVDGAPPSPGAEEL